MSLDLVVPTDVERAILVLRNHRMPLDIDSPRSTASRFGHSIVLSDLGDHPNPAKQDRLKSGQRV